MYFEKIIETHELQLLRGIKYLNQQRLLDIGKYRLKK